MHETEEVLYMTLISPHQWGKVVQPGLSACNAQAGRVLLGASFGLCPRIFGRSPIDVEGSLSVRPSLTAHQAAKPQDQGLRRNSWPALLGVC
jgi:hypothetical protein